MMSQLAHDYDAAVIGAGPYGLSVAAHLLGAGLRVAAFGRPMELWRRHMPAGMFLRSRWATSGLSDPRDEFGYGRFLREHGHEAAYPIPRQQFIDYALWFQRHAVPNLDETYVSRVAQQDGAFVLTLADGRIVRSRTVVMAAGLAYYTSRPAVFNGAPAGRVSHSADHGDFSRFAGRDVMVVGGGQSAIEYAALLHEAGARVHVVARRPIAWRGPDRTGRRSVRERIAAPDASIAAGWTNWTLDRFPYLFFRLPQFAKDRHNGNYSSGAADWLRARVIGKVSLHEARTVAGVDAADAGRVLVTLSDGSRLAVDHVICATGYAVDVAKLTMIDGELRQGIAARDGVPVLNAWFESTVPGMYFVGLSALRAFGPIYRFVAGSGATARRVARAIARRRAVGSAVVPQWQVSPTVSR